MRPKGRLIKNWDVYYYQSITKRNPVKDFLDSLGHSQRADYDKHLRLLMEFGLDLGMPHTKEVTGSKPLWELRPEGFRIIYVYFSGKYFLLLHGFEKKKGSIEPRHIDTAFRRLDDWEERHGG